jgi:hypothetical protein
MFTNHQKVDVSYWGILYRIAIMIEPMKVIIEQSYGGGRPSQNEIVGKEKLVFSIGRSQKGQRKLPVTMTVFPKVIIEDEEDEMDSEEEEKEKEKEEEKKEKEKEKEEC